MSTYLYDEALVKKISGWTDMAKLHVYGPNETSRIFETEADESSDKGIMLPMITLSRSRGYNIINGGTTKRPLSYDGATLSANDDYSTVLHAIPISLSYQLDVYARYAKEADVIMKDLVFNIVNYPAFTITIPKVNLKHTARITLNDTIDDNSDINERFIAGNFTRLSTYISVDDAYLWDARELKNAEIDLIIDDIYESKYDPYFPENLRGDSN